MLAFVFAGIGVKIVLKKDGEFSGTCASQSPFLNKEGEKRHIKHQKIASNRGIIFDRRLTPLAVSVPIFDVAVNPRVFIKSKIYI